MSRKTASSPAASERRSSFMVIGPLSLVAQRALGRFVARDIVRLHPARRSRGKAGLGTGGNLPRSLDVPAHESGLCRGQVSMAEVVLLRIGHGELAEPI